MGANNKLANEFKAISAVSNENRYNCKKMERKILNSSISAILISKTIEKQYLISFTLLVNLVTYVMIAKIKTKNKILTIDPVAPKMKLLLKFKRLKLYGGSS